MSTTGAFVAIVAGVMTMWLFGFGLWVAWRGLRALGRHLPRGPLVLVGLSAFLAMPFYFAIARGLVGGNGSALIAGASVCVVLALYNPLAWSYSADLQGTSPRPRPVRAALEAALLAGLFAVGTRSIFSLVGARPGEVLVAALPTDLAATGGTLATVIVLSMSVGGAVTEELTFRGCLQPLLSRAVGSAPVGLFFAAALFAAYHLPNMEPIWLKLAQTFAFGLGLGWLRDRHGLRAPILAHILGNVAVGLMAAAG